MQKKISLFAASSILFFSIFLVLFPDYPAKGAELLEDTTSLDAVSLLFSKITIKGENG